MRSRGAAPYGTAGSSTPGVVQLTADLVTLAGAVGAAPDAAHAAQAAAARETAERLYAALRQSRAGLAAPGPAAGLGPEAHARSRLGSGRASQALDQASGAPTGMRKPFDRMTGS